jgi:hypothetical protein
VPKFRKTQLVKITTLPDVFDTTSFVSYESAQLHIQKNTTVWIVDASCVWNTQLWEICDAATPFFDTTTGGQKNRKYTAHLLNNSNIYQ